MSLTKICLDELYTGKATIGPYMPQANRLEFAVPQGCDEEPEDEVHDDDLAGDTFDRV